MINDFDKFYENYELILEDMRNHVRAIFNSDKVTVKIYAPHRFPNNKEAFIRQYQTKTGLQLFSIEISLVNEPADTVEYLTIDPTRINIYVFVNSVMVYVQYSDRYSANTSVDTVGLALDLDGHWEKICRKDGLI